MSQRHLILAVALPPLGFWSLLAGIQISTGDASIGPGALVLLIGLAHVIPLGALAWILCSTAACSVRPGKLVLHSVVRDRELSLDALTSRPALVGPSVSLDLHGSRLVLWPGDPVALKSALDDAVPPSRRFLLSR